MAIELRSKRVPLSLLLCVFLPVCQYLFLRFLCIYMLNYTLVRQYKTKNDFGFVLCPAYGVFCCCWAPASFRASALIYRSTRPNISERSAELVFYSVEASYFRKYSQLRLSYGAYEEIKLQKCKGNGNTYLPRYSFICFL